MTGPFTYIYTISYPAGNVRYVGKSSNPKKRFKRHLRDARKYTTSHKLAWLNSLLNQGIDPIFEIIDRVPVGKWQEKEQYYIRKYKRLGFDLTNGTIGGDGNQDPSQEVRDKISASLKEHFKTHDIWNKGKEGVSVGWTKGRKRTVEDKLANSLRKREEYKHREPWNKGKTLTLEQCAKISASRMGVVNVSLPIVQYDLQGNKVDEWKSVAQAVRCLGVSRKTLHKCLLGRLPNDGQWVWKYLKTA